jgi:hypothetical protein
VSLTVSRTGPLELSGVDVNVQKDHAEKGTALPGKRGTIPLERQASGRAKSRAKSESVSTKQGGGVSQRRSRAQSASNEDDSECAICMSRPRAIRLRPCGHSCACVGCSIKLVDERTRRVKCPICKAKAGQCEWPGKPAEERGAQPPKLARLPTFEKALPGASALSIGAFVKAVAADGRDEAAQAAAAALLRKWEQAGYSRLLAAADECDIADLRALIDEGVDVNEREASSGASALHNVLQTSPEDGGDHGRTLEAARMLIEAGADIHAEDEDGETPLLTAAEWGNTEAVRLLLAKGAPADSANQGGKTPLFAACEEGHLDMAKLLHSAGADLQSCYSGDLPVHGAATNGKGEILRWIVTVDSSSLDICNAEGCTPPRVRERGP